MTQRRESVEGSAAGVAGPDGSFGALRDELWGRFLIWEARRRGQHSALLAAHDAISGDRVLLHVISRPSLNKAGLATHYRNAVERAAALDVPGVLPVLAHGASDNFHWYSTPLLPRSNQLTVLLREGGPCSPEAVIRIAGRISAILRDAHARGVAHEQLSTACVYVDDDGMPALAGFGTRRMASLLARNESKAALAARLGNTSMTQQVERDLHALVLLCHECIAGQGVVDGRQHDSSESWRALERVEAELDESFTRELAAAILGDAGRTLPSVSDISAALRHDIRLESDEEVLPARTYEEAEHTHVVLHEPEFVFIEEPVPQHPPPPQRRRWPLLASVAMTVCVTWLALEQVPRAGRMAAARTPLVDSSRGSIATSLTSVRETSVVRDTAPADTMELQVAEVSRLPPATTKVATTPTRPSRSVTGNSTRRSGDAARKAAAAPAPKVVAPDSSALAQQLVRPGRLFISTRPWGRLYVDGALIGDTPAADVEIAPGAHNVRVVQDGYRPYERRIIVAPGGSVRLIDILLVRQTP
jgi:hypothetical protein